MRTLIALAVSAASVLGACASQTTPYQSADRSHPHGFSETQIEDNRLRITFNGNTQTDLKTVERYVLFRAAETTLQRGYDFFIVVDRNISTEGTYRATGPIRPRFDGAQLEEVTSHEAIIDVAMFKGQKPDAIPNAYDARN